MKSRTSKLPTESAPVAERVSFRLEQPIASRFVRIVQASKRTKTSIIEECLERALPLLEKQYKQAA